MWQKKVDTEQTIFALASGSLPCAVAIVRVSGKSAFTVLSRLFVPINKKSIKKEKAVLFGRLSDLKNGFIDEVLVLSFVAPYSFTGEDVVEFQCHGSVAIVEKLSQTLIEMGIRPAEPGEFSYRAYLNGKTTPESLELIGDVYHARQTADLSALYARRDGAFQKVTESIRSHLIQAQAILDTAVDFADEYSEVTKQALLPIQASIRECSLVIQRYSSFKKQRIPTFVLAGRSNAGKSSLFNALLSRKRALVGAEPGTTRDYIEEQVELKGRLISLIDTAGRREEAFDLEKEGIEVGGAALSSATGWLLVVDGVEGLTELETNLIDQFGHLPFCIVWNKSDRTELKMPPKDGNLPIISCSALDGVGMDTIWAWLAEQAQVSGNDAQPIPSNSQEARVRQVAGKLTQMLEKIELGQAPEYLAEENRSIMGSIEDLIGVVDPEQVLDRVFGEFCIGK